MWLEQRVHQEADDDRLARLVADVEARGGRLAGARHCQSVVALFKDRSRTLNDWGRAAVLFRAKVDIGLVTEHLSESGRQRCRRSAHGRRSRGSAVRYMVRSSRSSASKAQMPQSR